MSDPVYDIRPLFLLGVPRSGTTFLQQLVNSHPKVFVTDELRVASWIVREAQKLREGFAVHGNPYPVTYGEELSAYLLMNAGRLIAPFYHQQAQNAGKDDIAFWGDKYPHYDEVLLEMPSMFPQGRYLMIHRDLRDAACSVMNGHGWTVQKSSSYVTQIYASYIRKLDRLVREEILTPETVFHVDYHELSHRVSEVAGRIFSWLGLETSEDVIAGAAARAAIQAHSVRKPERRSVDFEVSLSEGRWQRELSKEDLAVVDEAIDRIAAEVSRGIDLTSATHRLETAPAP